MQQEINPDLESAIEKAIKISEFRRQFKNRQHCFNQQFNLLLQSEVDWLKCEAEHLCEEYQLLKASIKAHKPMYEWGTLEVLIRENRHSFAIEWYQNKFVKINGQWRVFTTRMKLNKTTLRFSFNRALRAKEWELKQVRVMENKFSRLRKLLKKFITLRQLTR